MERLYNDIPEVIIQNGSDILTHIYTYASYLGWEVIDHDISGVSGDYVVIKSEGGTKNNERLPCYLRFFTNHISLVNYNMCVYWDPITHSYAGSLNYTTPGSNHTYVLGVAIDLNNDNVFHFRGNKDFIFFSNYKTSLTKHYRSMVFRIDNPFWNVIGHLQDSGNSANTVVTLLEGEVDQFELGAPYRTVSPDGHIDTATVFSKNTASNQMTITGHYYPTTSGTCIGTLPFPWVGMGNAADSSNYNPVALLNVTAYHYSTTASFNNYNPLSMQHGMVYGPSSQLDYFNHSKVSLWPYMFYENAKGVWGHSSYFQYFNYGSEWDYFAVNAQDSGVVSSATSTTLVGMNKNWVEDVLVGMTLVITSGQSEEEFRYIVSNTSDQLIFDPAITPTVSGAETFIVCEGVFMRYPLISGKSYIGIKEI